MALHGDLQSYPLPELLQWLDSSRKTGSLHLSWDESDRGLYLSAGQVVAVSSPSLSERIARVLEAGRLASGQEVLSLLRQMRRSGSTEVFTAHGLDPRVARELAQEELYGAVADLTQVGGGTFHWTEDSDRGDEDWVPVELGVRQLLFEALRWVDELAEVERALPLDSLVVRSRMAPSPEQPIIWQVILTACLPEQSLGRLRLVLGMPRSGLIRRVYDLLRGQMVQVEGAPQLENDPVADMLEKGAVLVRERQFEAAALVFGALLKSDPGDRRVREFAQMVEREHIASFYRELQPVSVPALLELPDASARLRPEERQVASLVNGKWDVATIVLASQSRELETLKCLAKLARMGLVQFREGR